MDTVRELSERERLILRAVVHVYISTAEPVGSRSIVKRLDLDISPATVRNTMSDLEEQGYLQQVHTSSGRVPTDRGYRYYVDYLMRVQELSLQERARIERELNDRLNDADEVMRQTSHLLAFISHQTGIVEAPDESEARVNRIELMMIAANRAAVLIADSFGRVRTHMVSTDRPVDVEQLSRVGRFLNDNFRGVPVEKLASSLQTRMRIFVEEQHRLAEQAVELLQLLPSHRPGQLYLDGTTNLFEQPEFRDVERAREVFNLLEERERVGELLRAGLQAGEPPRTTIVFGGDTPGRGMDGISVVTAPYAVNEKTVGMIGVLGPRRMPYSKVTALVEYTAGMLSRLLTRLAT
jgi:heat-inducible transcriptional repressor